MSRPSLPIKMVQCATSALLMAIEICNKPTLEFREQTFALLTVNAWEIFLKARIVQQNGGKIQSIYRRQKNSIRYKRTAEGEPLTISLNEALNRANPPNIVKDNIKGLTLVRNQVAHFGLVYADLQLLILQYGTASIMNYISLSKKWFEYSVDVPFLLPVGFVGDIDIIKGSSVGRQKILLKALRDFAERHSNLSSSEYAVALRIDVNLDTNLKGGGTIGITNDPAAPEVRIDDTKFLNNYPKTYDEIVKLCKKRYPDFKQNPRFHAAMREVKKDPRCAKERKLNPKKTDGNTSKWFYNWEATKDRLDNEYQKKNYY